MFLNQFSSPIFFPNKKGDPPRHSIQTKEKLHSLILAFTLFRVNRKLSIGMPEMNRYLSHPLFLYCFSLTVHVRVFPTVFFFHVFFFFFVFCVSMGELVHAINAFRMRGKVSFFLTIIRLIRARLEGECRVKTMRERSNPKFH